MSHKVWSDIGNNRLYIKIIDLEIERIDEFKEKISAELLKLKKGFSCICDLINLVPKYEINVELMSPDIVKTYIILLKYLYDSGMSTMIRIVDPQMYLIAKVLEGENKEGFSIETVFSKEQAEVMTNKNV